MTERRHKNTHWLLPRAKMPENTVDASTVTNAVLMDLRDRMDVQNDLLQRLVAVLECRNTATIPRTLNRIDKRLATKLPL